MTCLKYLVPISCTLFLGAVVWPLVTLSITGHTTWGSPTGNRVAPTMRLESQGSSSTPTATTPLATSHSSEDADQ